MAKKGVSVAIAIGKPKQQPPSDLGAPADFGSPPARMASRIPLGTPPATPPGAPAIDPDAGEGSEDDGAPAGDAITLTLTHEEASTLSSVLSQIQEQLGQGEGINPDEDQDQDQYPLAAGASGNPRGGYGA